MHCAKWKAMWSVERDVTQSAPSRQVSSEFWFCSLLCLSLTWANQKECPYSNGNIYTLLAPHLIQKLLSSLRAKSFSRCMKPIIIIINSHLNLIVRLPISSLKMSQNYAVDFSSLLNSSQYLLLKRFQSSAFSSVLSICAYTSTPCPLAPPCTQVFNYSIKPNLYET